MEPYNRFLPKKAGAVPCDGWYLALQTNVGVDPVVVGHIAAGIAVAPLLVGGGFLGRVGAVLQPGGDSAVGLVLLRFVKITGEHHGGAQCGVLFLYCIIS